MVAPKERREQVTADFALKEYLSLQSLVYRFAEAVREEVGAERMYLYAVGSNQGQQGAWASWEKGVLKIPEEDMAGLAGRIGRRL